MLKEQEYMRVVPFSACPTIPTADLSSFECSDRLLLPSVMESYAVNTILLLSNAMKEEIVGCVHGLHEGDVRTIFIPSWMFYQLTLSYDMTVSTMKALKCTHIQLRPHRGDCLKGGLRRLNIALLNYKTLTQNTRIPVDLNPPEMISIELMMPERFKTCFVFNCGDIGLTVLPPLEEVETASSFLVRPVKRSGFIPFMGAGHRFPAVEGYIPVSSDEDVTKRMMEAAKRRIKHL
jgi:hypothetical protein